MRFVFAWLVCLLTPLCVSAQDAATPQRMVAAFESWMASNGVTQGTLAIRYKGAPVLQHGVGMTTDTAVDMASLSKAITGVCVAELVRAGKLAYSDSFAQIVGRGPDVTIAQLLSQTSGLKQDSTQKIMRHALGDDQDRAEDVLDAIVERGGPLKKPGRQYRYNNENYALLGLAIEAVMQNSYEAVCTARVLDPAGVQAVKSDVAYGFLAWGGWKMTANDYAAFLTHWFAPNAPLGAAPFALPHVQVEGGAHYGHGMFFRAFRGGHNYWHHGALCFPGRFNTASFAVSWKGEWSAVATYGACPDWDIMSGLDRALSGAVFQ